MNVVPKFWNTERKLLLVLAIFVLLVAMLGEWDNWADDQEGAQPTPAAGISRVP